MKTKLITTAIILMISISNIYSQRKMYYWDYLGMTRDSLEKIMYKCHDTTIVGDTFSSSYFNEILYLNIDQDDTFRIGFDYDTVVEKAYGARFMIYSEYIKDVIVKINKHFKRVPFEKSSQIDNISSNTSNMWIRRERRKGKYKYFCVIIYFHGSSFMTSFYLYNKNSYKKTRKLQFDEAKYYPYELYE